MALTAISVGLVLIVAAGIGAGGLIRRSAAERTGPTATPSSPGTAEASAPGSATPGPTPASAKPSATVRPAACAFPLSGGVCPAAPPLAAPAGKRWKLSFSEEFSGSTYDHSKLTPCFDWNTGDCTSTFNNGREHYQPSQVVVSNGTAKLIAAPLAPPFMSSACQGGACTYKAGLLSTARAKAVDGGRYLYSFTYGYVESRFKFPATQGFFTAFWMLPTDPTYTYRSEIDILELLGDDPSTMFMTYHYAGRDQSYPVNQGKFNNGACPVKNYATQFVRMGVDWQPDHIAWYIDGKKCAQFTDKAQIENGPMQLILHMMVDNDWQRRWNVGLKDPTLVRQLEVDYIRVYQSAPA
jgi:hypothetical protein